MIVRAKKAMDALAITVALVAVWTGTPVGGLAERAVRKAAGLPPPHKPLIAYFDVTPDRMMTWVVDPRDLERPITSVSEEDETVVRIATKSRVEPALARAFAVVSSGGRVALDESRVPWYDVRPLPHHVDDRALLGLPSMDQGSAAVLDHGLSARLAGSLDLLSAYEIRLGGEDAALAAWAIGLPLMERAVDRARQLGEKEPAKMEGFESFLTRRDKDRALAFLRPVQALRIAYEMRWPLEESFPITSPFGMRPHPIHGRPRLHAGIDLGAPEGTPIQAASGGIVEHAGKSAASGLNVRINHGHGLATAYLHASRLEVRAGQEVFPGQTIARVGSTGMSTGPHLHFGVYVSGQPVDPLIFRPPEADIHFDPSGRGPPPRANPGAYPSRSGTKR